MLVVKRPFRRTPSSSKNGEKRLRETNKGWEIPIQWKYGLTTWESMKYVKEC